jgi:hypothetical protein
VKSIGAQMPALKLHFPGCVCVVCVCVCVCIVCICVRMCTRVCMRAYVHECTACMRTCMRDEIMFCGQGILRADSIATEYEQG